MFVCESHVYSSYRMCIGGGLLIFPIKKCALIVVAAVANARLCVGGIDCTGAHRMEFVLQ